ncbi:MAG: hypothetical protein DRG78_18180 [Epsilonproteobacteria bacterium]|nr:MAG: hypothetical protein DRG78_18180 [Campylobacterota bacterium]
MRKLILVLLLLGSSLVAKEDISKQFIKCDKIELTAHKKLIVCPKRTYIYEKTGLGSDKFFIILKDNKLHELK